MKFFLLMMLVISISLGCSNANNNKPINNLVTTTKDSSILVTKQDTTLALSNTDTLINQIKKDYAQVNSLKLTATAFDIKNPNEPDDSGKVTYFLDNAQAIVKIVAELGHADYEEVIEYYYKNNKVFFIFKDAKFWAATGPAHKYTQRWYIHNDIIIKEMNNDKIMESKDNTRTLTAYKWLAAYKTKNFLPAITED